MLTLEKRYHNPVTSSRTLAVASGRKQRLLRRIKKLLDLDKIALWRPEQRILDAEALILPRRLVEVVTSTF